MRLLIDIAVAIVIAATIGLGTAWYAVDHGTPFNALTIGAWTAYPLSGSPDADPYSIARLARTGEVPLGAGEGLAFTSENDSDGVPLAGNCTYAVAGQMLTARLWTLTAYGADGRLMATPAGRYSLDSREVVRRPDGSTDIAVSSAVQPGNWLPVAPLAHFKLMLRLYDTPVTIGGRAADLIMPSILRGRCH